MEAKVLSMFQSGEPDNNIGRTSYSEVLSIFFLSIFQQLLPTSDKLFQFHRSYKSCESRPVWGAKTIQALWPLLKGFIFL